MAITYLCPKVSIQSFDWNPFYFLGARMTDRTAWQGSETVQVGNYAPPWTVSNKRLIVQ